MSTLFIFGTAVFGKLSLQSMACGQPLWCSLIGTEIRAVERLDKAPYQPAFDDDSDDPSP